MPTTEKLIVNCLPLTEAEQDLFQEASGGVRQLFVGDHAARYDTVWQPHIPEELRGRATAIIGTGDLGSSIGTTCAALGARTVGVRRDPSKPAAGIGKMHGFDELDALIPAADVIMVCVPGTPETRGLIDAVRLEAMRRSAILVNVGRDSVIDTDALARALATGEIRGAAIDVTDPEPLPAGHPLWSEPRCLITPHVAGGNHLADVPKRIFEIAVANLRRYAKGELPGNPVH